MEEEVGGEVAGGWSSFNDFLRQNEAEGDKG